MARKKSKRKTGTAARKPSRKGGSRPAKGKSKGGARAAARRRAAPAKDFAQRADLGATADGYFELIPGALKDVARQLRAIVRGAAPDAKESIKWGMPVYEHNGMLCYIRARPAYITLGFYEQGIDLIDPTAALEGTGQQMRHVKVASASQVQPDQFRRWVQQAVSINAARAGA